MISKNSLSLCAAFLFVFLPAFAQAQSSDFEWQFAPQGAEARLSFTVPLGASKDRTKTAPRLDFAIRNYQAPSGPSTDWMLGDKLNYSEARLGLRFSETPQLMLNEQVLILTPEQEVAHINNWGKAGLTVAAVALAGIAVIAIAFVNCDNDPGGCFGDE